MTICAVISAPLTAKFKVVMRKGGDVAPFTLLMQPGASCTFEVQFFQPDNEELTLWDNYRDAIVVYTER